jgi:hypothetical protein
MAYKDHIIPTSEGGTGLSASGANGNVLTSNGTIWVSSASPTSVGFLVATGTLTSLQIKSLNATPVVAIASPGVGKVLVPVSITMKFNYAGTNPFVANTGQKVNLAWGASSIQEIFDGNQIAATQSYFVAAPPTEQGALPVRTYAVASNSPLNWYNGAGTEVTGNAANDNTMPWQIIYYILTI